MKGIVHKKACSTAKGGNVIPFEQDAAFYLHKGMQHYQKNKLNKALLYLQKAVSVEPDNPFNHYNLGCMLSKLGQLKEANRVFLYIINKLDRGMTDCYFLLAVNYGLLEEVEKSREYLGLYLQLAPEGELALEAQELLQAFEEDAEWEQLPTYTEHDLSMERLLRTTTSEEINFLFTSSREFRRALSNRLYNGSDAMIEEILDAYAKIAGAATRQVLRKYVRNPWIKERFRQMALLKLKNLGEKNVRIFAAGEFTEIDLDFYPLKAPHWQPQWQQVMECTLGNMRQSNCYDEGFFADVQAIWYDFINTVYPETPRITKIQTWAAALEYSLIRFHFLSVTQNELAMEYGVSCASISKNYRKIEEVLHLNEKAYQNMLNYLNGDYEE